MLYNRKLNRQRPLINLNAIKCVIIAILASISCFSVNAAENKIILAFGDSLTAGYGLGPSEGFTAQLQDKLNANGLPATVINAGVSGDTTSGAAARLEWVLERLANLDLVIITLGGNDALRGINPEVTRRNMDKMISTLKERNIPTLIGGMLAPPNLGSRYMSAFNSIYPDMAKKYDVALYPFFLDGVIGIPELNQRDRIHPNTNGVKVITDKLSPVIIDLLQ